mgnify:FL=1
MNERWMDFTIGFWAGLCFSVSLGMMIGRASAAELDIAATQAQVNAILQTDIQELPAVYIVDGLPRGTWGTYAEGEIRISAEAPEGCRGVILGHETSHHIAIKAGLLRNVPSDIRALKAALEAIAKKVEAAWPEYLPGCMSRAD